ncbi:hypothetical protein [Ferrovum sp. PN-J185]|uniref:hypothetical protein n=1 Tax=Ferrovum sp. PN-J185 TaxID=1356306 RepID=UPI00079AEACD|nr:hypothetical protein [Ferrovum sp. PN-J185]KXW55392.1 hypothetical protein FV185_16390 [Ferrovum sp. PN-J185]
MAKIELLFGGPIAHDEEISVENYAYNWDVSIETAIIRKFKSWISYLSIKSDDKDNTFFELLLFIGINQMLKLPKITSGTYRHKGFVLPKIIIHGDHGVDKQTGNSVPLTKSCINIIGNNFEDEIGYEYFEYRQIESGRLPQLSAYL